MSQLLQFKTGAFTDAVDVPDTVWNGIPMESDGSLAIDTAGAITHNHQGLPFTAEGRLAAEIAVPTIIVNGAMPITAAGRLAFANGGVVFSELAANSYNGANQLILGVVSGTIEELLAESTAHFDETTIVGATTVTAWNNKGAGGAAYNLDTVVGTAGNLTRAQQNGMDVVNSAGAVSIKSAVEQTVATPYTAFVAAKVTTTRPGLAQDLIGSRDSAAEALIIRLTGPVVFLCNAGISVSQGSGDLAPHIHTVQQNADASSVYEVSDIGSVTGDIGTRPFGMATLFAGATGSQDAIAWIAEFIVFDRALTDDEITAMQAYLGSKWL